AMRLAAKSDVCDAAELLEHDVPSDISTTALLPLEPRPRVIIPIRTSKDHFGVVALSGDPASDDDLQMLRAAGTFLGTLMTNQRMAQEAREGDFQLKYRLWELESLYDIGLSIAATLNIDELADEILFRMISLTNARRAALYLRDAAGFILFRSFGDVRSDFLDKDLAEQLVTEGTP